MDCCWRLLGEELLLSSKDLAYPRLCLKSMGIVGTFKDDSDFSCQDIRGQPHQLRWDEKGQGWTCTDLTCCRRVWMEAPVSHWCKDCRTHLNVSTGDLQHGLDSTQVHKSACYLYWPHTSCLFMAQRCYNSESSALQHKPSLNVFMPGVVIAGLLLPWHANNNPFFASSCSCHVI